MSAMERASSGSTHDTQVGDVSGAVHAGRGDIIQIEKVELAAARVADGLRRALSADEATRTQLLEVLEQYSVLQAQMGEWKELHHMVHEVLAAFSPFCASLHTVGRAAAGSADGRALLRGWRPCQADLDRLADFESGVEYIRLTPGHEDAAGRRPDWGTRIAALRREIEDTLREEKWNVEELIDVADEFGQACHCYLCLADRELRRVVERVQRLHTHLLGGLL